MSDNYKKDAEIDLHNLHEEWAKQPSLYIQWAEKYIEVLKVKNRLEKQIKEYKAELSLKIRKEPTKFIDKLTENALIDLIYVDSKYREMSDSLLEWESEVELLKEIKNGLKERKDALQGETDLFVTHYFSVPHTPKALREQEYCEMRGEREKGLEETRQRRLIKR